MGELVERAQDRRELRRLVGIVPDGGTARRVAAMGEERVLDLWALQRAMQTVHDIDLRRWRKHPKVLAAVFAARREVFNAYLAGFLYDQE